MKKLFNKKCSKTCKVHELATHNTCLFCEAMRKSPYLDDEIKQKSDEEIKIIQQRVLIELEIGDTREKDNFLKKKMT